MESFTLVQGAVALSGGAVLVLGQRFPKWTSFGLGFGLGAWMMVEGMGADLGILGSALSATVGLLVGVLVLTVRKVLPLVLGLAVGGYVSWLVLFTAWGDIRSYLGTDMWLFAFCALTIVAVIALSHFLKKMEQVAISLAGAVLVCAAFGLLGQVEWVLGLALAGMAFGSLRAG